MSSPDAPTYLSIVVVNWNVAGLLARCLHSIEVEMLHSAVRCEVIVVDNASDQRDFLNVLAEHPGIRLIELQDNIGYGAACNAGAAQASGEVLLFLNPDTELLHGTLQTLIETLELSPEVGLVAPLLLNSDRTVQSMGYRFPGPVNVLCDLVPVPARLYASSINNRVPPGNGVLPRAIDYALGAALLVRRAAFDAVGGFDQSYFMYSEEVDLQRRLADAGWRRLLAPGARIIHHGGQSTGQRAAEMHEALWMSRADYFDRWSDDRRRKIIGFLVDAGTRLDSRRHPSRNEVNARIRQRFRARRGVQA